MSSRDGINVFGIGADLLGRIGLEAINRVSGNGEKILPLVLQ